MLATVPTFVLPSFLLLEHVKTLELVFTILFRIWDILLNFVKFSVSVKYWVVDENLQMSFFFLFIWTLIGELFDGEVLIFLASEIIF